MSADSTLPADPQPVSSSESFRPLGKIPPRKIPLAYRLALGLTAFAMVLLPLVYIAIIMATGYGVYRYAIWGTVIFSVGGGGFWKLLVYVAPIIAGSIAVIFMIKPLFARPVRAAGPLTIDLDTEPKLREFISSICQAVGAPMPTRVDVDCQVNASARLRRGLLSIGRRDLALTIGLPLAGGLSARQFAGVLAHEFGHFAQGAGMAFTFVIRSINGWFARVVFERDSWDAALAEWSEKSDYRVAFVVATARGAVWLSRKLLHGLMYIGHAITCLQLRQMEFDADYYEISVAGSADFTETFRELSRLSAAAQAAFSDLDNLWRNRQLTDDFPGLIAVRRTNLDAGLLGQLDAQVALEKTHWFDTHPSTIARIAEAERLGALGTFSAHGPAAELFTDFAELSRTTTRHFYRAQLGLSVDENSLVAPAAAGQAGIDADAARAASERLTASVINLFRPLVWREADFASTDPNVDVAAIRQRLAKNRAAIAAQQKEAQGHETTFGSIYDQWLTAEAACALLSADAKVNPSVFNLAKSDLAEAQHDRDELIRRRDMKAREIKNTFETSVHDWVCTVGQAARAPTVARQLPSQISTQVIALTETLHAFTPWFTAFPKWHLERRTLATFLANEKTLAKNEKFSRTLSSLRGQAHITVNEAPALVGSACDLSSPSKQCRTATELLNQSLENVHGPDRLTVLLQTVASMYFRLLGQLALAGEEVEKVLAAAESSSPDSGS